MRIGGGKQVALDVTRHTGKHEQESRAGRKRKREDRIVLDAKTWEITDAQKMM